MKGISGVVAAALLILVSIGLVAALYLSVARTTSVSGGVVAQASLVNEQATANGVGYVVQLTISNKGNAVAKIDDIKAIFTSPNGTDVVDLANAGATISPSPSTPINPGKTVSYILAFNGPEASSITFQITLDVGGNTITVSTNPISP